MKLVLVGIQGSGKSTQGNKLSAKIGAPYLSTGHIARDLAKEKTQLGRYVKETINAGFLIRDDIMNGIVKDYLEKPEYQNGYILDGYPRTLGQAEAFKDELDGIVYIKISDEEALKRLTFRVDDREDDTAEAIKKRISLFHEYTEPVLGYYKDKGIMYEVDGEKPIEEIFEEICKVLKI